MAPCAHEKTGRRRYPARRPVLRAPGMNRYEYTTVTWHDRLAAPLGSAPGLHVHSRYYSPERFGVVSSLMDHRGEFLCCSRRQKQACAGARFVQADHDPPVILRERDTSPYLAIVVSEFFHQLSPGHRPATRGLRWTHFACRRSPAAPSAAPAYRGARPVTGAPAPATSRRAASKLPVTPAPIISTVMPALRSHPARRRCRHPGPKVPRRQPLGPNHQGDHHRVLPS